MNMSSNEPPLDWKPGSVAVAVAASFLSFFAIRKLDHWGLWLPVPALDFIVPSLLGAIVLKRVHSKHPYLILFLFIPAMLLLLSAFVLWESWNVYGERL